MKILLIGEYSNLHNSLKQGLQKNGFEVTLLSTGDGFKNFDSDIPIKSSLFEIVCKSIALQAAAGRQLQPTSDAKLRKEEASGTTS